MYLKKLEETNQRLTRARNYRRKRKLAASEIDIILVKNCSTINSGRGINRSNNPKAYKKEAYYKEYQSLNNQLKIHLKFENQGIILQLISRFLSTKNFKQNAP